MESYGLKMRTTADPASKPLIQEIKASVAEEPEQKPKVIEVKVPEEK